MELLTKEDLKLFLKNHRCNYFRLLPLKHSEFFEKFIQNQEGNSNGEKIYRYLFSENGEGKCLKCGKPTRFLGINKGYSEHCSLKCSNSNLTVQNKKKSSYLTKYGVINPSQSKLVKSKKESTFLKNFGETCNLKTEETKNRIRKTNQKKYGVDYPTQAKKVKSKIYEDNYERFFVDSRFAGITPVFSQEEYKGVAHSHYSFRCDLCGHIFIDHMRNSKVPRCLKCFPKYSSKFQREICEFLKEELFLEIEENNRKLLGGKELDIFLPKHNIAIEFDGLYYHSEITGETDRNYHLQKTLDCSKRGISLIHIFEDEWRNKKEIVKNNLKNLVEPPLIFNGEYVIRELDSKTTNDFLDAHHLRGKNKSSVRIGAFHKGQLVSVMTFGKSRKSSGEYSLVRFFTSTNITDVFGKLLKYFVDHHLPQKIIGYLDLRWFDINGSKLYEENGFVRSRITQPSYWYVDRPHSKRFHRFSFRKSQLSKKLKKFDPNLSEWENMKNNGYDRIWDCGNLECVWKITKHIS